MSTPVTQVVANPQAVAKQLATAIRVPVWLGVRSAAFTWKPEWLCRETNSDLAFFRKLSMWETYCAEFSPMARHSARAADVWSQPETDSQSRPTPVPRAPIEFIIFLGKNRKVSFVGKLKSIIPFHLDAAVDTPPVLFLMLSESRPKGAELSHITRKGRPLSRPFWKKTCFPTKTI